VAEGAGFADVADGLAALAEALAAALAEGLAAVLELAEGLVFVFEEPHAKRPKTKTRVIRIARIFFIYLVLL
jgi:hypothetical protein